jgi:hypothetical protein
MSLAPSELELDDGRTAICRVCRTGLVFFYIDPEDSLDGKTVTEPEGGVWAHTDLTLRETAGHAGEPDWATLSPRINGGGS